MTRGWFAIGIDGPKTATNVGTLWRHAYVFGAAAIFTIGRRYPKRQASDTVDAAAHIPCFEFGDVAEAKAVFESTTHGCVLVGVEWHWAATPLPSFWHPPHAVYLLGAEDHGLSIQARAACRRMVTIPYATQCLNVAGAGTVVMYDRAAKRAREGGGTA